jgi:hypothetical protein
LIAADILLGPKSQAAAHLALPRLCQNVDADLNLRVKSMAEQSPQAAPWETLGFEKRDCEASAERAIAVFKGWNPPPDTPERVEQWTFLLTGRETPFDTPTAVDSWVFNNHLIATHVFAMGALGYTIDHPVLHDWREAGRQAVPAALYYLFGPWREKFLWRRELIDRQQARARLPWISCYRDGLEMALALGDWPSADRLLEWPGPDLMEDEGFDDRTAEDNAYQIWLAMRVRGETGSEVDARRDLIARRSRQRPKLLALAADALLAAEHDQFANTLSEFLKYYRKREIDLRPKPNGRLVRDGISLDGTVLWHLARRRGMREISLSAEDMLMIARP